MVSLSRRQRQELAHRQEILGAALVLFSEHGFQNVSMRDIAGRADFSIGSLYNYFQNKEDIYRTLLVELVDTLDAAIATAFSSADDPVGKLRACIAAMGRVFRENLLFIRLYHRETASAGTGVNADVEGECRVRHARFVGSLADVFAEGIARGIFRPIATPQLLAVALDSFVAALLIRSMDDSQDEPLLDNPDVVLSVLFEGLLAT